eukprot:PhF_6_TR449/c0_g1_i1/m.175
MHYENIDCAALSCIIMYLWEHCIRKWHPPALAGIPMLFPWCVLDNVLSVLCQSYAQALYIEQTTTIFTLLCAALTAAMSFHNNQNRIKSFCISFLVIMTMMQSYIKFTEQHPQSKHFIPLDISALKLPENYASKLSIALVYVFALTPLHATTNRVINRECFSSVFHSMSLMVLLLTKFTRASSDVLLHGCVRHQEMYDMLFDTSFCAVLCHAMICI